MITMVKDFDKINRVVKIALENNNSQDFSKGLNFSKLKNAIRKVIQLEHVKKKY